jgi:metabotropic X receptor
MGTLPSMDMSYCIEIPQEYLSYNDALAIGAMVLASCGMIATVFVIVIFIKYRDTPVVKASGRELSFVLLVGIFLCYGLTFILVSRPHEITCGAQKYGLGLCFSIIYAAILTKTNRIARIFRSGKRSSKRPKFISPKSQLVICGVLVAIQNAIGVVWLLMSPPAASAHYANRDDHQLVCKDAVGGSYMIGFSYPILLVIVCTVYAILTRKIPEGFNESKYIGFTMYTTCIIWLAFVPIFFSTAANIQIRIATMCFSISLSSTVTLVCMFTPKLYIIVLHPERNIRQSIMASSKSTPPPTSVISKQNNYSSISSTCRIDSGTQSDGMSIIIAQELTSVEACQKKTDSVPARSVCIHRRYTACHVPLTDVMYLCQKRTLLGEDSVSVV